MMCFFLACFRLCLYNAPFNYTRRNKEGVTRTDMESALKIGRISSNRLN